MKLKVTKQPLLVVAATWRGDDPETGWAKIRYEGRAFYGVGFMAEDDGGGTAKVVPLKAPADGLIVRCAATGRMMRFFGALLPANRAAAWEILRKIRQVGPALRATPKAESASPASHCDVQRRQLAWFDKEMARVRALQSAGSEPSVGLRFMIIYLGESRASLQRKIGKDFPKPTKRGGRNFWPLSQVDAYAAGKAMGPVAAAQPSPVEDNLP